jgi:hypothetical protein
MKLTYGRFPESREWDRRDVGYDDPLPLDWRELLDPWLWIGAVLVLVALVAAIWLIAAFVA